MRTVIAVFSALLLTGCVHKLTLTDFQSGTVIKGKAQEGSNLVTVTMPDGEILEGKFKAVSGGGVGFTFSSATTFGGTAVATGFGSGTTFMQSATSQVYVLLKSKNPESKLMLELIVTYSGWTHEGFGEARTNDGRQYRVEVN